MTPSDQPFQQPLRPRWIPREMIDPPLLDHDAPSNSIQPHYALLVNPFYPKDPHASFGKHVLTPTLALTSFAATTPASWRIEYWDENLLRGRTFRSPVSPSRLQASLDVGPAILPTPSISTSI